MPGRRAVFNVGVGELLVILLLGLIVLGPEKLPDAARKIGNVVGELRRMSSGVQHELRAVVEDLSRTPTSTSDPHATEPAGEDDAAA